VSILKIFGWLTVAVGLIGFIVRALNLARGGIPGGHDLTGLTPIAALTVLVGLGLILRRRWAAALSALLLGGVGLWLGVGSILTVPLPWSLINLTLAAVLLVPSVMVLRHWSQLNGKEL
jgi:hypothetical protein